MQGTIDSYRNASTFTKFPQHPFVSMSLTDSRYDFWTLTIEKGRYIINDKLLYMADKQNSSQNCQSSSLLPSNPSLSHPSQQPVAQAEVYIIS